MSRRLKALFFLLPMTVPAHAAETGPDPLARYVALTSVEPNCRRGPAGDEIVVCGRRAADRYRVPLLIRAPGDPKAEGLPAERVRLQHITTPCQDNSIFLVGCGMVGVSVSTGLTSLAPTLRPLAP